MAHWLFKSEPNVYSITDLARDKTTLWDGVRNYQARNYLRDSVKPGDWVLFYHSNAEPPAIAGLAKVARGAYPDPSAFDPKDEHYDAKSNPAAPTWYAVDLRHVKTYAKPLGLPALKSVKALTNMVLLQKGSRLSIQPVTPAEFAAIEKLAG